MTDRNRSRNYYERDRSYSRDKSRKYYDKNKSCRRDRSPRYYKNNYEREYYTFQDHGNRRQYKKSYNDKHREENHKYKRSRDYYEDVYEHQYNRDEYEHQYKDESCHMPPHFQVQSTFVNHCDTYMVIHPCMIQNDSFSKTNQ